MAGRGDDDSNDDGGDGTRRVVHSEPLIIAGEDGDVVPVDDDAPFEEPAYTVDHLSAVLRPVMLTMVLAR
jgi:hypothetical protein